jgi:hypothetical protein
MNILERLEKKLLEVDSYKIPNGYPKEKDEYDIQDVEKWLNELIKICINLGEMSVTNNDHLKPYIKKSKDKISELKRNILRNV